MRKQAEETESLPPEVENLLPQWRERLQMGDASEEERLRSYWELGKEMAEALSVSRDGVTKRMLSVAERLGRSRPLIYNLVHVGSVFADGIFAQNWSWHLAQARRLFALPADQRAAELALLRELAPGQSAQSVLPAGPKRPVRPADELLREAEAAFRALPSGARLSFLRDRLRDLDSEARACLLAPRYIPQIIEAAQALAIPPAATVPPKAAAQSPHDHQHHHKSQPTG